MRFVQDVLGGPDRADEIEEASLEDYAGRRKIEILENPQGGISMPSKEEMLRKIKELEEENDELQDQLDEITDIVAGPEEEEGEEGKGESD
ncbi:hypothetical protein MYX77_03305 [Acidobacteriia bacterium AH_259_A11_L15]|nr:hypothetical protein [Acidobacteriia bacterium AH_259_A11_L15]